MKSRALGATGRYIEQVISLVGRQFGTNFGRILIKRFFTIKSLGSSSRAPDRINKLRTINVSRLRYFSCITLKRLRRRHTSGSRGVGCDNSLLGCSISRTSSRGKICIISASSRAVTCGPLRPLGRMQIIGKLFRGLVGPRGCHRVPSSSCITIRLRSHIPVVSIVGHLGGYCPQVVRLGHTGKHIGRRGGNIEGLRGLSRVSLFGAFCGSAVKRSPSRRRYGVVRLTLRTIHGKKRGR